MLIQYIQFKMQANLLITLQCLHWGAFQCKPQKDSFHEAELQEDSTSLSTGINITGNVCNEDSPEE